MLNDIYGAMSKPLKKYHAVIDKFIGDAIVVLFDHSRHSDIDPISCAIEMLESIENLNIKRREEQKTDIKIELASILDLSCLEPSELTIELTQQS